MEHYHEERAAELFAGGCNCAQAVFTAFCDVTKMDETTAMKLSSSFGAGMGRMREVCGAVSGLCMVLGMLYGLEPGFDDVQKKEHYARIQETAGAFREAHGTVICRELLKGLAVTSDPTPEARTERYYKVRPCVKFVRTAARLLDEYIAAHPLQDSGTV